jgi:hypothetical protein
MIYRINCFVGNRKIISGEKKMTNLNGKKKEFYENRIVEIYKTAEKISEFATSNKKRNAQMTLMETALTNAVMLGVLLAQNSECLELTEINDWCNMIYDRDLQNDMLVDVLTDIRRQIKNNCIIV